MTAIAYDLFDNTAGIAKVQVMRFSSVEAAKAHATPMYGEFVGCDEDGDILDIFTDRGFILSIEPVKG